MPPDNIVQNQVPDPTPVPTAPQIPQNDILNSYNQATSQPTNVAPAKAELNLDKVPATLTAYIISKFIFALIIVVIAVASSIVNPLLGIIILGTSLLVAKSLYEKSLFKAFAVSNNFDFQSNGIVPPQTGHLFFIGNSNKIYDVISGTYANRNFLLFLYTYDIGYGRNRQSYHRVVLTVSYGVNLPTFILRRTKTHALINDEGDKIKANGYTEKLNLEGDFNKNFDVFIPQNSEQDVLTILTPDIMQLLLPLNKYELELTPNGDFYLYTFKFITNKKELVEIYKIFEAISIKIGNQAELQKNLLKNIVRSTPLSTTTPVQPTQMPQNPTNIPTMTSANPIV